jgi:hypothetical protein
VYYVDNPARNVNNSVRNVALQRLLEGHRLRVSAQPYVIASIGVHDDTLRLRFRDAPLLVSIDLPNGFATDAPEHLAWLFFNIERAVSEARES